MNDQNPTNLNQANTDQVYESTLLARMAIAPGLNAVRGTVSNGVATLTGFVVEEMDIKRAILIAKAVEGITEVRETIKVVDANKDKQDAFFKPAGDLSDRPVVTRDAAGDFTPIDENLNNATIADENMLASSIIEGMDVFDSEGNKVGKVKMVRATDFLLGRFLIKDYYVPYFSCELHENGVHLKIKKDEIKDQGWASPHQETP